MSVSSYPIPRPVLPELLQWQQVGRQHWFHPSSLQDFFHAPCQDGFGLQWLVHRAGHTKHGIHRFRSQHFTCDARDHPGPGTSPGASLGRHLDGRQAILERRGMRKSHANQSVSWTLCKNVIQNQAVGRPSAGQTGFLGFAQNEPGPAHRNRVPPPAVDVHAPCAPTGRSEPFQLPERHRHLELVRSARYYKSRSGYTAPWPDRLTDPLASAFLSSHSAPEPGPDPGHGKKFCSEDQLHRLRWLRFFLGPGADPTISAAQTDGISASLAHRPEAESPVRSWLEPSWSEKKGKGTG